MSKKKQKKELSLEEIFIASVTLQENYGHIQAGTVLPVMDICHDGYAVKHQGKIFWICRSMFE